MGLLAALLAFGMGSAPGRRELRWFGACAAFAALFNLVNVTVTLRVPLATVLLTSRLNLFFGGLHCVAWFKYAAVRERRPLRRLESWFCGLGLVISASALVPGLVLHDWLFVREVPWLGVVYADAPPTTFGVFAYGYHLAGLVYLLLQFLRRRFRGDDAITAECVALAAIILAVVHDSLDSIGLTRGPYFLDVALLVMVLAVGGSLTRSFVANARELEASSRNLALAQEQLVKRERLAAIGELAAVVAHEVRNPVAVMFNATAGLRKVQPGGPDHDALVDIVREEAEHLRDIVRDLLEFAHPRPPLLAPAALEDIVRAGVAAARREAQGPDSLVQIEEAEGPTTVTCDERLVRQAVINLVTNALQAPGRRGPVRVRIEVQPADERREELAAVHVIDDGRGVPEELRERIFTPFYTSRPSGTGLGLAIVRSSADAHGGDVSLAATPGGGATFSLRLPRRLPAA
ncbi:MAG: Flagellar sensor histidine kinase FleS [Labilithrix sp.]|nr:Flagellar sensor histidine kinase FleS [Labilithrix sp.]